jgi:hypothetical protein
MTLTLSSNRPVRELTEFADKVIRVQLERAADYTYSLVNLCGVDVTSLPL